MDQKQIPQVEAYLNEQLNDEKQLVKRTLIIPCKPDAANKSLRVTDEFESTHFYASTRIETLKATENGYEADVTTIENLAGKTYNLKEQEGGKLVQEGKISVRGEK